MSALNERYPKGGYLFNGQSKTMTVIKMAFAVIVVALVFCLVAAIAFWLLMVVAALIVASPSPAGQNSLEWIGVIPLAICSVGAFAITVIVLFLSPLVVEIDALMNWAKGREPVMPYGSDDDDLAGLR